MQNMPWNNLALLLPKKDKHAKVKCAASNKNDNTDEQQRGIYSRTAVLTIH